MSQPPCYGLDPEYTEEEFLERERRAAEARDAGAAVADPAEAEPEGLDADADPDPGPGRGDRTQHLDWCTCGNCIIMPTARECICCQEVAGCADIADDGCITDTEDFASVCLTRVVLRVLHVARRDIRGHAHHVPQELSNK